MTPTPRAACLAALIAVTCLTVGCGRSPKQESAAEPTPKAPKTGEKSAAEATPAPPAAPAPKAVTAVVAGKKVRIRQRGMPRGELNRLLAALDEPVFWRADDDKDGLPDADELVILWHRNSLAAAKDWARYVNGKRAAPGWRRLWNRARLVKRGGWPWRKLDKAELQRRDAVLRELQQGRPTLLYTDLSDEPANVRQFAGHMAKIARYIEVLYRRQVGSLGLDKQIPARDLPSQALYNRNQGPWCQAPETESDATCHAIPAMPKRRSGLYPLALQEKDPKFCERLAKRPDAKSLLSPFTAVRADPKNPNKLVAVPYPKAFPDEMAAIARELELAARAMTVDAREAALVAYLKAAAAAFRTNDWFAADEAWAKMAGSTSQWYVRVGPDETYFEPCSRKAGFHLVWARVDPGSAAWKEKLEPRKNALEALVAKVAGAPYRARKITFHLPEFIHIVLNAGDSRSPTGATVGQSLPNWGPVAEQSRGRTVAMTNLYTDADSVATLESQAASLFCKATLGHIGFEAAPQTMSTVLHEAGHNLGPSHAYTTGGQTDDERFGGPLAAILEELKAQTMALHFNPWLVEKKLIDPAFGKSAWLRDVAWAFGHISRGMTTTDGKPKAYSQLAAVQVGLLLDGGGLAWRADELAANGKDKGCFAADFAKFRTSVDAMATTVYGIKARGDAKAARALVGRFVKEGTPFAELRATIRKRWLRAPRASFVYGLKY